MRSAILLRQRGAALLPLPCACQNSLPREMRTEIIIFPNQGPDAPPAQSVQTGKFIQLRLDSQEYLVFAPLESHQYHNQILAHFLEKCSIPHRWIDGTKLRVDAPGLAVLGGGRFRADATEKVLELWDNSQAYGRFAEQGLADKIAAADHPWRGFDIRIS